MALEGSPGTQGAYYQTRQEPSREALSLEEAVRSELPDSDRPPRLNRRMKV